MLPLDIHEAILEMAAKVEVGIGIQQRSALWILWLASYREEVHRCLEIKDLLCLSS